MRQEIIILMNIHRGKALLISNFIMILVLMGIGSIIRDTVMSGCLEYPVSDHIIAMDVGLILIMDGRGSPIIVGAGAHSIMADG